MEYRLQIADRPVLLNIRPNAISLMLDDVNVFTFDRAGRLVTAVLDGHTYRRGLDGRVLQKWCDADGARKLAWLPPAAASDFLASVYAQTRAIASDLKRKGLEQAAGVLTQLNRAGADALQGDAKRFSSVYLPVTILPPDQYLALVLQVTEGCQYNRCTFCSFYRDRPFRMKTLAEVKTHIAAVCRYLGAGAGLRRSIFLADANALCMPRDRLLPVLDAANLVSPAGSRPIYSFVDIFSCQDRTASDYAEMRERNVRRLYLGVETGCLDLLRFLRKPQTPAATLKTVEAIKQGGLNVGIIIMLGIGGAKYDTAHVDETVGLLNSLPWSDGDRVFLSPLHEFSSMEYTPMAAKSGIIPLSPERMSAQYAAIRSGIVRKGASPIIAPYGAEQFIY